MATATTGRRTPNTHPPGPETAPRRSLVPRSRGRIAAGAVVLVCAAALAFLVYGSLGNRQPVLVVTETVDPGERIEASDLDVVMVAADRGVATVPADQRDSVIGRRATTRLLARSLLTPSSITDGPAVPDGHTSIGAVVRPGQYPLGLRSGDAVTVVVPGDPEAGQPTPAVILGVGGASGPDGTAISLAVPDADARRLAVAGSEGRLLLMVPSP